jgi:hypothetical protein
MLALAVVWLLFVPAADWLAHHDVGSVTGSLHETALDNARGRLLTLGAGLFAAGALVFTARNFTLSRRTFELTEQGQVTDRYTKAIEQLGSDKMDVRIGGIYALERIARDSPRDHPTVMEVLAAFIREHSPPDNRSSPSPDVQAALTVIGRRDATHDRQPIDLIRANLYGAQLGHAYLVGAYLVETILAYANLDHARLDHAILGDANLTGAYLDHANLDHANLTGVILDGAILTETILTGARWDEATPAPEGWVRDPGTGLLKLADQDVEDSGN